MSLPVADLQLRKRAIATGLQPYIAIGELPAVLEYWEQYYAEKPSLALQYFVADIAINHQLTVSRATLLRSLIRAMGLPAAELIDLPSAKATPAATESAEEDHSSSQAFSLVLTNIMGQLSNEMQHKLRLAFFAQLRSQNLPVQSLQALQNWLSHQQPLKLGRTSNSLLQRLITEFYTLLCHHFGPTEADVLLARALQMAKQSHPELDRQLSSIL
jgi:hypothetical protein